MSRRCAAELEERFPTLHLVGRNGMHRYNNQDHAMMTAMLTVENIVAGQRASTTSGASTRTPNTTRRATRGPTRCSPAREAVAPTEDQAAALASVREVPERIKREAA